MLEFEKTIALALCLLLGCSRSNKDTSKITVEDTLYTPIIEIKKEKKAVKPQYFNIKDTLVVVFYTMQGCKPCGKAYPWFQRCAKKYPFLFFKEDILVNWFSDPKIKEHQIYGAPTVIFYQNGKPTKKLTGCDAIVSRLEKCLQELSD
ncbi:MAG: thioredoxin family protein [Candidatus Edwardsbacteria bacterium]